MATRKDPAAVSLGKRGGAVKVPKGFAVMDEAASKEIQRKGAEARWAKAKKGKKLANKGVKRG